MNRYRIGILAFLGLAILFLVLLFSGGSSKKPVTPHESATLPSYASSSTSEVEMVIGGPIVANQNFSSVQVTIAQSSSTYNLMRGYEGQVVKAQVFNNNQNAYTSFLYALYYQGFSNGLKSPYASNIGMCPTGQRYDFYLRDAGQVVAHYWATDCSTSVRTYGGNVPSTINLFEAQIPNFAQMTEGSGV